MTKIKVFRKDGHIMGLEVKGHTGLSEEGTDVLCSAVSALTQGALLGLKEVARVKTEFSTGDGYLKFNIFEHTEKTDAILETMYVSLKDIQTGYKRHIKMEDCKYVY